ncbi:MAG: site-specific DNA-methyltransferase, partial [Chloroflexota bacterium]
MAELIWDGKYDEHGRRNAPVRVGLPFQTVETVNESAQQRQRTLDLFSSGGDPEWRNRLVWGDKKYVLPSLLSEFAGKVDLIYIDPPFATGADFSHTAAVPDDPDEPGDQGTTFTKQPSLIEQKAYRDTWGRGLDGYLQWFYETSAALCDLLRDSGCIYVHIGPNVDYLIRACLDEVFGRDNFRAEIIWKRVAARSHAKVIPFSHDSLFLYSRSNRFIWNPQYVPTSPELIASHYNQVEPDTGRRFTLDNVLNQNPDRPNLTYEWKGITRTWRWTRERMAQLDADGRLVYTKSGMPRYKRYLDESRGTRIQSVWTDIHPINSQALEDKGYPTQKSEVLLERIVRASSNEGGLVLDCFCGSGTTPAVAEKLNRRWIAADLGRFAINTTRKRLLSIPEVKPFVVQNLGKYERQAWQGAEFGDSAAARELAYRRFILDLFHAQPISGYAWLHGLKNGHLVHVGSVDAPISVGDVQQIALEFRRAMGSGENAPRTNRVDILGWDFAFELNEVARQQAALANLDLHFVRIPREVLEKKAVEQGDICFFELAALAVGVERHGRDVSLALTDFVIPLDDVPEDIQRAVTHWSQWIDYWAVDWDNKGDTFHDEWQTYRTRKDKSLQLEITNTYAEAGEYTIVV